MKPNDKVKRLADQLKEEFNKQLPVSILPNGDIVYKNYLIRQNKNNKWTLHAIYSNDAIEEFNLKSCALIAAKEYNDMEFAKYNFIRYLDNKYWANHSDTLIYKYHIKNNADENNYDILLTKLEDSKDKTTRYKNEIFRLFRCSFA